MSTHFVLRREFIVIALAVLAFVVLLSFAMTRLVTIERDTHSSSGEGIIWALSQTQYEIQRLLLATTPDRHASADEIGLRFDILLSRLNLLQDGPLARRIAEAGRGNVAARAIDDLLELEPLIASSGNRVERYSARLSRTLLQYVEPLGSIANELMIQNRVIDGQRRYSYNASIVQVIVSILGIMATGAFLIARLVRSLGQSAAAEAQVRRERNFLDLLLESSGEGIAAFDSEQKCTHWNEGMARLLGVSAECCLGRPIGSFDTAIAISEVEQVLAGQRLYLAPQRDGAGNYLERLLNPIWLNGAVTGGIVIVRNVTERYEAQRERQLREMYRDFVTMVSHQFRTPLAIIDSTMQRIVRRGSRMDEAELADRAKTIRVAVAGLSQLIDSTLATERVDAGAFDLTLRPVDMPNLLREVVGRFVELSPERRIDLKLARVSQVDCDALLIDQAFANLVANAIKYSPKDKPVEVALAEAEGQIAITVTDQGDGIPEHEQQQIFDRFYRSSTTSTVPGNGVGLYAARQIARLHGGTITVTSRPGKGSTFTMLLPRSPLPGALS